MCNIAGYAGSERAAPILLELIERQEGLAGGYYTGIATIHEGRLHWRKVVGDCARLREETDADDLPGSIGLAHSRSNSGGDRRWSHPFIACDDSLAYIANGAMLYFDDRTDTGAAARALEADGHVLTAVADGRVGRYPSLEGGRSVHVSDVMAHAIEAELAAGTEPCEAIRRVFLDLPAEIVGLFITPTHSDSLFAARYTMPMCVAIDAAGARVASSPTGFGGRPEWWTWVPPFSVATVRASGLEIAPLACPEGPLPDDISRSAARTAIVGALREQSPRSCDPAYEALFELLEEGVIEQSTERVPGAVGGITAPRFQFALMGASEKA